MKIYLAGPDVFRDNAEWHGAVLKLLCEEHGHEGLYPLDNEIEPLDSKLIFEGNLNLIKECDVVLANMTPFRGPSMDVGTAWEIGAAKALGKRVLLYNSSGKLYKHKCDVPLGDLFPMLGNFGLEVNLMLIHGSDGIFKNIRDALEAV